MNNKFFAFFTALCCGASMMAMPAFAQDETLPVHEYIVIGVDDNSNPEDVIILEYGTDRQLYLTQEQIELYLAEGDRTPRYGDKLTVKGNVTWTELAGTNYMHFDFDDPYEITNEGSIYSETVEENFVVTLGKNLPHVVYLSPLDNSEVHYHYYSDVFTRLGYSQPKGFDWNEVETGDEVTFLTYEGCPVLPVGAPSGTIDVIVSSSGEGGSFLTNYDLSLTASEIESVLTEGSAMPTLGDVICYEAELFLPAFPGRAQFGETGFVTNLGPVWDYYSGRSTLTVTVSEDTGERFLYTLLDEETEKSYQFDFVKQGSGWNYANGAESMRPGDMVTFVINENGRPVYPLSVERLGDANADGDVSIVDVVMVNRHVMGADMARTTMNTDAADFDKNGEVTHEDSLSILKRLVGLV